MTEINKEFGVHYLVEFIGCDAANLKDVEFVQSAMLKAAEVSNATIVNNCFHQFEPQGVSGFVFIMESHFSIHTWPEDQYAAFDIFTCGEMFPDKAIDFLSNRFHAAEVKVRTFQRGF